VSGANEQGYLMTIGAGDPVKNPGADSPVRAGGLPLRDELFAGGARPKPQQRSNASDVLAVAGLVLSLVALTHIVLIWLPPHFGSSPWEFAAATQTVDVFPIAVAGMALVAYAAFLQRWRKRALALAVWGGISAFILIAAGLLILLNLPVAWQSVTEGVRTNLLKTSGKAMLFAAVFAIYYLWLTLRLIRSQREN
jgi:hypothetical protein